MTDKRPTICKECKHIAFMARYGPLALCDANPKMDYVSGKKNKLRPCESKNDTGNCADFEAADATCTACGTPLTSSDQYDTTDGKLVCAKGYGCREAEQRHSVDSTEGVQA